LEREHRVALLPYPDSGTGIGGAGANQVLALITRLAARSLRLFRCHRWRNIWDVGLVTNQWRLSASAIF
jgi:hypothetical protein